MKMVQPFVRFASVRFALMTGVLLLIWAPIAPRAWAADTNADNVNVDHLLDQARFQAHRLDMDTNNMTGLIRSTDSWQIKSVELAKIKRHVNDLGQLIPELESSRVNASPWQKEAIDRALPLLREVALNTTFEIDLLKKHEDWPNTPEYTKWAADSATAAHELDEMISDTVQYGHDRADEARLSDELHLQSPGPDAGSAQDALR